MHMMKRFEEKKKTTKKNPPRKINLFRVKSLKGGVSSLC